MLNGVVAAERTLAAPGKIRSIDCNLNLGNQFRGWSNSFPGKLDEVRISNVVRSDDWIKATYDTIKNNSTFTTYGAAREQTRGFRVILM